MRTIALPPADFNTLVFAFNGQPRIEGDRAYLASPNADVEYVTTLEVRS